MKLPHTLRPTSAGPIWGLALGLLLTTAGIGLWWNASRVVSSADLDESLGIALLLLGIFAVIYAAHELRRR